jgi:hypothetical protein
VGCLDGVKGPEVGCVKNIINTKAGGPKVVVERATQT